MPRSRAIPSCTLPSGLRVPPPRLREPSHQRVVGAVEEHHLQLVALAPDLLQGGRGGIEEPPLPRVDHNGEPLHLVAGAVADQLQQLRQQRHRQVVDAEEPEVLQRLGGGGFPRPDNPVTHHDAVRVCAALGRIVLRGLRHYSTSSPIPA